MQQSGTIYFISGGQRSGKSEFAERLALSLSDSPVYLATARIFDEDMAERVRIHQARRGECWTNIEETVHLSSVCPSRRVVLIDCVTLWITNLYFDHGEDTDAALETACREIDALTSSGSTIIFVTNEIGLGGVSENRMQRHFTDLQGRVNQIIASKADMAYLLISGIPVKIKP